MLSQAADRFWAKVDLPAAEGCWIWSAARNQHGYGRLTVAGRQVLAHRFCWELHNGPVPPGLSVLHRCDVPGCVNPGHLFIGTQAENMRDKATKGRASQGPAHGMPTRMRHDQARLAALADIEAHQPTELVSRALVVVPVDDRDRQLVAMWVARSESPNTRRNYQRQADRFLSFLGKPLATATLADVQAYLAGLTGSAATRANATAAIKSLLSFGQETGFLRFNVGRVVKAPSVKNVLAERIMGEGDVLRMIALEPGARNRTLLTVLYGGGLRISEVCGLCWRDLAPRDDAGQATVYGKGGKTRVILLSVATWKALSAMRGEAGPDAPVFVSRKGAGRLDESMVHRIVKAAAARAGLSAEISAHWLRHAHASHSLDRGAPIHLVQATLGHASVATTGRYLHARPSDSSARYLGV